MRILTVHAKYTLRGGEDEVRESERDLLRTHGHDVAEYVQDNESIKGARPWSTGVRTVWSRGDYAAIRKQIQAHGSEIVTVHNFFPLISPAVYYAARAEGVPVIQTLHNFRLICPGSTLLRDGRVCTDCVGKTIPYPGVAHGCYRGSAVLTAGVSAMVATHRLLRTWDRMVDRYIVLSDFMRKTFVAGGFPADKLTVKPNYTSDVEAGDGRGAYFLYVGRLSAEKGVATLLRAWELVGSDRELRIIGSGPEEVSLKQMASTLRGVRFLGQQPRERVQEAVGAATAVIVPSVWNEPFGLTVIEALAKGTPVIGSAIGSIPSLITLGRSGTLFEAGNANELAHVLKTWVPTQELREGARAEFEARFTPERNYTLLMEIYGSVLAESRAAQLSTAST